MRVVVALGGNALLPPDGPEAATAQQGTVQRAAKAIAANAAHHAVVVTHGNGPQVGLLALQATAFRPHDPDPLDVLGAESEGMIGYMLERALMSALPGRRFANRRPKHRQITRPLPAHARHKYRDENGTERWACGECDCTDKLEARLSSSGTSFLAALRQMSASSP